MELLPDDIHRCIFDFLSTADKRIVTKVCTNFKRNINSISLLIPRMEHFIERTRGLDQKFSNEMMLIANRIYIPYKDTPFDRVNPLFNKNILKNTCIVGRCREKRLGTIYSRIISTGDAGNEHYYSKRKVPYCLHCFNIWHSRDTPQSWPGAL